MSVHSGKAITFVRIGTAIFLSSSDPFFFLNVLLSFLFLALLRDRKNPITAELDNCNNLI